jgi:hypothetical protein
MADPLSIATSIAAVLQLAYTVIAYLNDVKDASKERNRILLEISSLSGLLYSLKVLIDRPSSEDAWLATTKLLGGPDRPLAQLRSALDHPALPIVLHCSPNIRTTVLVQGKSQDHSAG